MRTARLDRLGSPCVPQGSGGGVTDFDLRQTGGSEGERPGGTRGQLQLALNYTAIRRRSNNTPRAKQACAQTSMEAPPKRSLRTNEKRWNEKRWRAGNQSTSPTKRGTQWAPAKQACKHPPNAASGPTRNTCLFGPGGITTRTHTRRQTHMASSRRTSPPRHPPPLQTHPLKRARTCNL